MTGTIVSLKPLLALGCPLLGTGMIFIYRKQPNVREGCTLAAAALLFAIVISMAPPILAGKVIAFRLITICPGLELGFRVDAFGLLFAITSSFLWILVSLYSIGYMRALQEHAQTRYYCMFALAIFSAVCIAMAENLVTFYVFYEALTLSTYWLVAHHEDEEAFAATRKYLTYLLASGWFLFAAVVLTYALAGTTRFADGGILTTASASRWTLIVLFALFALGSMKAAWMPLHSWLPAAMVAPTPVSSLLHAVAVVKAGVFGFVRIVCHIFGVDLFSELGLGLLLGGMASFTMIVASFMAIGQDNLKRRLAYSTISQLSYILFGVALLSPFGIKGAMIHIPFHAFMKITLFLCAGAIMVITGKKAISQMAGIGRQMPITMAAFTVGAVGMCGAPPVAGFISKWFLCLGSVQSGHLIFLGVILVSSLLDVVYFFPIIKTAFFDAPQEGADRRNGDVLRMETRKPLYLFMIVPLALTALFSIVFCFFPGTFFILDLVEMAVNNLFNP
ncbi:MAG: monovalent cation/H+ antiporter subunit D family protein [Deltaproteobacteria bacterium]|nr:monovalent cation/H+ antiporter subunit D family protein [Deltaproteobacteria bacterium]MBW2677887.1 monovalent cation/H+ antiporter subunit D family protein [Deltaproteobacteria bacterium]